MKIGARDVGPGHPAFLVCELSANHNGSLALAHKLVDAAADAGADAIKLQTYDPDQLAERRGGGQAPTPWEGMTLRELYRQAVTPRAWHAELFAHAKDRGLIGFSSAFSPDDVAFLDSLDVPAVKVSAYESSSWDILEAVAQTGRPAIVSLSKHGAAGVGRLVSECLPEAALLHCVSQYPARCADMDLRAGIARLPSRVRGLSDHTVCEQTAALAVALGASIIEAHLMLQLGDYGAQHPLDVYHSYPPDAFADMVTAVRHAEETL